MLPAPAFSGKTGASVAKAAPNLIDALSRDAPDLTQRHAEPPSSAIFGVHPDQERFLSCFKSN
jgi:hypothetical protein